MRFYLKKGGWGWSVYHRLSHCYIAGFDKIEGAAEFIETLNAKPVEAVWRFLIATRYVRMPRKEVLSGTQKDGGYADNEKSYEQAWRYGTEEFYAAYPHLLVEEKPDHDLYQRIAREVREEQQRERDEMARARYAKKIIRRYVDGVVQLSIRRLA